MAPQLIGHSTSLEPQATPAPSPAPSPTAVTSDPLYPEQWHLNNTGQGGGVAGADVKAEAAWTVTRGKSNIIIAINDDGVDVGHEDLKDRIVPGWDFLDNDNDPSPAPDQPEERKPNNHGTACAGVAVATGNNGIGVTGMSPNARIMPLRVLGNTVTAELWAKSFEWAADHGADIISNSWGPGKPEPTVLPDNIRAAINYATEKGRGGRGCVILFAAGNYDRFWCKISIGYQIWEAWEAFPTLYGSHFQLLALFAPEPQRVNHHQPPGVTRAPFQLYCVQQNR